MVVSSQSMQEATWYDLFTISKDTAKCIVSAKTLFTHNYRFLGGGAFIVRN